MARTRAVGRSRARSVDVDRSIAIGSIDRGGGPRASTGRDSCGVRVPIVYVTHVDVRPWVHAATDRGTHRASRASTSARADGDARATGDGARVV